MSTPRTTQAPPRSAAIETLLRLERTRNPVKPLFEAVTREYRLAGADRNLAMTLVYGVLRHRQYLERLLKPLCRRPIRQLDPVVRQALLVGLHQLFCLDRIPDSAAVNETVNGAKGVGLRPHLHGFINGVLRAATRQRSSLPGPDDRLPDGSMVLNHPEWLTRRWRERFGQIEMERICAAKRREPVLTLRVNSSRTGRGQLAARFATDGIIAQPGEYGPDSLVLPDYQGRIPDLPGYNEGLFQVQDEAAQLAVLLLAPFDGPVSYLDGCAGLGGKTSHILQLMAAGSRLVAVEPEPHRLQLLQENLARLEQTDRLTICAATFELYSRDCDQQFERILIDAPCSGTGVTGRHPDIRWNRRPEDLAGYQQQQLALLLAAAELTTPKGVIVYATCSIEPEENEQVVTLFQQARPDFEVSPCASFLPEAAAPLVEGPFFAPRPSAAIDGFFAARLARTG